uniref:Uncharacterized protein n=1 Tax=Ditylenchus dipsaci TaxID=166011 RepID=A0A915EQD8_9BILA
MLKADSEVALAEQKRKQYAFQNSRSHSAPPRKRKWWYRKGPLREMGGSQQSLNYDRMVSRRLIGAIATWHDIHSNLLQLTLDQKDEEDKLNSPMRTDVPGRTSFISPPTSSSSSTPSTTKSTPNTGHKSAEEKRQRRGKERLELFVDKNQTISLLQQHHSRRQHHHLASGPDAEGQSKQGFQKLSIGNSSYYHSSTPNSPVGRSCDSPSHLQASSKFNWSTNSESALVHRASDRSDDSDSQQSEEESDYDTLISEELLDEIVELEKRSNSSKFSLSNPELTTGQLKAMFPELSEHWRLPANDLNNTNSTPLAESPAAGANSVFSFRKSSIAAIRSTLRRGSLAVAGGGTKATEKDPAPANIAPKNSWLRIYWKRMWLLGPLAGLVADSSDESARSAAPELVTRVDEEEVISPTQKKPLGPSLSWDPEKRSRSPSTTSRSRIQSDGKGIIKCNKLNRQLATSSDHNLLDNGHSANNPRRRKSSCYSTNSPRIYKKSSMDSDTALYDRLELEKSCLHCSIGADYRRQQLKAEIENAVKRLSRRLDNRRPSSSWPRVDEMPQDGSSLNSCEQIRRSMGTPDIVVSSFSSDDDPHIHCTSPVDICFAGSVGSPSSMSITSPGQKTNDLKFTFGSEVSSPRSSIASPFFGDGEVVSPMSPRDDAATPVSPFCDSLEASSPGGKPSNLLKPPGYTLPTGVVLTVEGAKQLRAAGDSGVGSSNSPPRSNSIDLSTLRRDIELFSVSSGETTDMGSDNDYEPATPAESVRTVRSRSHDPSQSPDHLLRRPSRIEHLSEIFRKALAKSPVVKRAAAMQEQEQKRVCKHRTSRYWLEEIDPHEHIWLPSSGPGSTSNSTDTECYIGEKDCEKVGDKRRCAACHIVAHTACFRCFLK